MKKLFKVNVTLNYNEDFFIVIDDNDEHDTLNTESVTNTEIEKLAEEILDLSTNNFDAEFLYNVQEVDPEINDLENHQLNESPLNIDGDELDGTVESILEEIENQ